MRDSYAERPIINRCEIGPVAGLLWPGDWCGQLADALDWNIRTVQRLGTVKMPIDHRRALLMADILENGDAQARQFSDWLRVRISEAANPVEG